MKTLPLVLVSIFAPTLIFAQTLFVPSGTSGIGTSSTGGVGIGTSAPSANLHIGDGVGSLHYGSFGVLIKSNSGDRALMELHSPDGNNKLVLQSLSGATYFGSLGTQIMVIQNQGGKVGIGTNSPDEVLTVNGKIKAEELQVVVDVPADYVFEKDYRLRSLDEVKQFITDKKHLPGMPSSDSLIAKGWNVGEMNNKLLEKVEELTLYIISQQEQLNNLQKELNSIKSQTQK